MAGLLESNVVLSNFGTRIFITDANITFTTTPTAPSGMVEVLDVIGAENLGFSRDSQDYQTLANGGWPKKALLGFQTDDINLSLVRSEQGAYNENSTYWIFNEKLKQFKVNKAYFGIIIVRPVSGAAAEDIYEARYWTCFCSGVEDSADGSTGREYSVTISRSGAPTELTVTENPAGTFKFALKGASADSGGE